MARNNKSAPVKPRPSAANDQLPKGWRIVRFDELAQIVNERVDPSATDAEIYVGLEHLDSDSLKIRRWGTPSDVIGDKLQFRKGDIIFGRRRAYQRKLAVAEFDGICSAHAMVLRANTETVDPEFLPFLMQSDLFMERAIDISVGSLSPTINWKTLRMQEFPLPPKDEQRRKVRRGGRGAERPQEHHRDGGRGPPHPGRRPGPQDAFRPA
jgi:restriction endonuclease S subunit